MIAYKLIQRCIFINNKAAHAVFVAICLSLLVSYPLVILMSSSSTSTKPTNEAKSEPYEIIKSLISKIKKPCLPKGVELEVSDDDFIETSKVKLPDQIKKLFKSNEVFSSGYLDKISSFWIATSNRIYFLEISGSIIFSSKIGAPVVTAFIVDNDFIILSHQKAISMLEYKGNKITPLNCTYSIPKGVTITCQYDQYCGCSDGCVRGFRIEKPNRFILLGNEARNVKDPVRSICGDKTILYVHKISGFIERCTVSGENIKHVCDLKTSNVSQVIRYNDAILAPRYNLAYFYIQDKQKENEMTLTNVIQGRSCTELFGTDFFSQVIYVNGVFACVKPSTARTYDSLIVLRVASDPKAMQFDTYGRIFQVVARGDSILLLTSAGIVTIEESDETMKLFDEGILKKLEVGVKIFLECLGITKRIVNESDKTVWFIAKELTKIIIENKVVNEDKVIKAKLDDVQMIIEGRIRSKNKADDAHNNKKVERLKEIIKAIKGADDEEGIHNSKPSSKMFSLSKSNQKNILQTSDLEKKCFEWSNEPKKHSEPLIEESLKKLFDYEENSY